MVPEEFQAMLGSSVIHLQPGSMKKQLHKERYNQQFVFEIESDKDFKANEKVFWLKGPSQNKTFKGASTKSQMNVISNKFSLDESPATFKFSLHEFKFKLDELLETFKVTSTKSQTNMIADVFSFEELHANQPAHFSHIVCPFWPQDGRRQRYISSACPVEKIMTYESSNKNNLLEVHSSEGLNRDSSGPLGNNHGLAQDPHESSSYPL